MTDLRTILGDDRYDDVIEKAALPITGAALPAAVARALVSTALAAVLPDLLAEAWDAGWFTGAADIQIRRTPRTPNPYRQEQ